MPSSHALLRRSPLQPMARLAGRNRLRVLAYHGVSDRDAFERQLDHIVEHYVPVDLSKVIAATRGDRLPDRAILVTFDDGHRSWVEVAAPEMARRGMPGVAFVVAGAVGSSTPYWWDEVAALRQDDGDVKVRELKAVPDDERQRVLMELRQSAPSPPTTYDHLTTSDLSVLEDAGIEVGNHTLTHPILDRCDHSKMASEVFEAKERLEDALGHPVRSFAYPNGNCNSDVSRAVAEAGHDIAFLFDHALQPWPPADTMAVSRIRVNAHDPLNRFAVRISGLHPAIHRLRGRS